MKTQTKQTLKSIMAAGALALATLVPSSTKAQSVYCGFKGPTEYQVDNRTSYNLKEVQNGTKTETLADNLILKYWTGTNNGVFAFANVPYKAVKVGEIDKKGLGDVFAGIGPRFERKVGDGKLGVLSYAGITLPTGDEDCKPALGTGRKYDVKAGLSGTLLSKSGKSELDFSADYTLTKGGDISDEINAGITVGGRINDNWRFVVGPMFNYKSGGENDGDSSLTGRLNARYTPSDESGKPTKKMHFEIWADKFMQGCGKSCPKENYTATLVFRRNF